MNGTLIGIIIGIFVIAAIALGLVFGLEKKDDNSSDGGGGGSGFIQPFGSGEGKAISYGNTSWVAVGYNQPANLNSSNIVYSSNGETWHCGVMVGGTEPFGDSSDALGIAIAYGGNSWVAVGDNQTGNTNSSNIVYSSNGQTWHCGRMEDDSQPFGDGDNYYQNNAIVYGGNSWVAVGNNASGNLNSSNIVYSSNGETWHCGVMTGGTEQPFGDGLGGFAIAYGNTSWVAVGYNNSSNSSNIVYSSNGETWHCGVMTGGTEQPFDGGDGFAIAYDGTTSWIAVGDNYSSDSSNIVYSSNGQTWHCGVMTGGTEQPFGRGEGSAIAYDGTTSWVAVGNNTGGNLNSSNIVYSSNGETWHCGVMTGGTEQPFGSGDGKAIAYDGTTSWVAVGNNTSLNSSNIVYSSNGETWHCGRMIDDTQPFGTGHGLGISFNGTSWVAVGNNASGNLNSSNIVYSSEGEVWYKGEMKVN